MAVRLRSCVTMRYTPLPRQEAEQEGNKFSKKFLCNVWEQGIVRSTVGCVSTRSRNGAPSRKGCVVNGQIPKASNK